MAANSLAPGFITHYYTSNAHPHVQVLPVIPFTIDGDDTTLTYLDGTESPQTWADDMGDMVAIFMAMFDTVAVSNYAELWSQPTPEDDPVFVSIAYFGVNGAAGVAQANAQLTLNIRGDNGTNGKFVAMESAKQPTTKYFPPSYDSAQIAAMVSFLTSDVGFVYTRGNGKPVLVSSVIGKVNDALRKKYFLGV